MKKRKLVLALMLSLMMLVTMIPSFSFADATGGTGSSAGSGTKSAATSGTCGATENDHVTWKLTQNNDDATNPTYTLTIDGSGAMADYKNPSGDVTLAAPWYQTLSADAETKLFPITNIEIGDKVTGLGDYAFAYTEITAIGFHKNVTDYGDNLYSHCSKVKVVDWAGFNPKNIRDGYVTQQTATGSFIPFSMFDYCENLNQCKNGATTYPAGKLVFPENITGVMTAAFRGTGFSSIDFESSNLTRAGAYVFSYMPNLTELTLPGKVEFYQQNGGQQSSAFQGSGLRSVTVESGVTTIPSCMFCKCTALTDVTVAEGSCMETIGLRAFDGCEKLKSFNFPDSLKEIQNYAFQNTALTRVTIGQLKTMGSCVFLGCTKLENVKIEGSASLELAHGLFGYNQTNRAPLKTLKIGTASVTSNPFTDQKDTIETIEFENVTVNNGSYMFQNCTALKSLTLGNGFTEITSGMVSGCSVLETIVIPDTVTAIAKNSFKDSAKLKNVTIGTNVASIGDGAFQNCAELETIAVPDSVTAIGDYAFSGCSGLETVSISNGSNLKKIGNGAFRNTKVNYFYIPSGLTSIGSQAFFTDSDPGITNVVYDLSDWDVKNLTTSTFGKWCFSQYWKTNNDYTKITRTFYLSDKKIVNYLPISANSQIYKDVDGDKGAERTMNAIYAVTNGGNFAADSEFTENTLATPTKANYRFLGWYNNEGCTGQDVTTPEVRTTYYAKWEAKAASDISFKDDLKLDKTYNGNPIELTAANCIVHGSTGNITFSYQKEIGGKWTDLDAAPVNAGRYRVKATVAEDDTHASAKTRDWKEFTISKADPAYTAPNNLTAVVGQTLADVPLTDGFTWKDDPTTSVGNAGTKTFKATYTPTDTDNYNTVNDIEITLTVNPKMETLNAVPVITAEDKTLTVGDTFNPLDGVTASDKEDGVITGKIEVISNNVDTSKAGLYSVTYKVTDKDGASAKKSINVVVKEKTAPPTTVSQNGTKTGDAMPIGMLAVLMLAAAAGIVFCGRKLYKSR